MTASGQKRRPASLSRRRVACGLCAADADLPGGRRGELRVGLDGLADADLPGAEEATCGSALRAWPVRICLGAEEATRRSASRAWLMLIGQ